MSSQQVVMFCFGGRRANMELQLPFIHRILAEHPNVEYHLWNLARTNSDARWIRGLPQSDQFRVINDHVGANPWTRFNKVYEHYTDDRYGDCLFVKLDDDVVFLETLNFGAYLDTVKAYPHAVVSAKVINNGACTRMMPGLWAAFKALSPEIPLLDVHMHLRYLDLSHQFFFDHWPSLLGEPSSLMATEDWLSINVIGYDHAMARELSALIDSPSPREIAGRLFGPRSRVGDEGAVNLLPRLVFGGFTACHLSFGPQALSAADLDRYRGQYAEINDKYLTQ